MQLALDLAAKASQQGDVPVGTIVLNSQGDIVGRGFNTREVDNDPMNHAEIVAMREAAITNNCSAWIAINLQFGFIYFCLNIQQWH